MNHERDDLSTDELHRQREGIRQSLRRVNTLALAILLVVVVLALLTVFQSHRVQAEAERAREATRRAEHLRLEREGEQERQREAHLRQVRAWRESEAVGQRAKALELLDAAARLRPAADLRWEAMAWLNFSALVEESRHRCRFPAGNIGFDAAVERVAMAWDDQEVHVFRLGADTELFTLPEARGSVGWLRFSPDGRWLVARHHSMPTNGVLWNTETRQVLRRFQAARGIFTDGAYDFSPDSRTLATADGQGRVAIFDLTVGGEGGLLPAGRDVQSLKFSPDGEHLAVADTGVVEIWNLATRTIQRRFETKFYIDWIAWHPDGRWLGIVGASPEALLWNWSAKSLRRIATGETRLLQIHFHPHGHRAATWSLDGTVTEWDLATGQRLTEVENHRADHYSTDGRRLGFVKLPEVCGAWRLPEHLEYRAFLPGGGVFQQVKPAKDELLLCATAEAVMLWDAANGLVVDSVSFADGRALTFVPGENLGFAANSTGIVRWPLTPTEGGKFRLGSPQRLPARWTNEPEQAVFSPDGSRLAARQGNGWTSWSTAETPGAGVTLAQSEGFGGLAFSPDSRRIAGVSTNALAVWEAATGACLLAEQGGGRTAEFSSTGRWLVTAGEREIALLDTATWQAAARARLSTSAAPVTAVAFTPDAQWLAAATAEGRIRMFRTDGLEAVGDLAPPRGISMRSVCFSEDGARLIGLSQRGNIYVWDLALIRAELARLRLDFDQPMLAATPMGAAAAGRAATGTQGLILAAFGGVLLALLFGILALRRYRNLVEGYFQVDALVTRRNEQLSRAQAELFQSQKMRALGTLAAGIAHDFNNLLSVIRMANYLTGEQTRDNADAQENARLIEKTVTQGKAVVRSMLGYSRKPGGRTRFSAVELVEETLRMLHKQFLSGITLDVALDRAAPEIEGERNRLEQILLNLIVNAAEAMDGRGRLRLEAKTVAAPAGVSWALRPGPAEQYVEITLSDTGPGMSAEVRERIFEPFFTTKTLGNVRGTGLGLSMVYAIAQEEHLGLAVESETGRGTTFRILVPVIYDL